MTTNAHIEFIDGSEPFRGWYVSLDGERDWFASPKWNNGSPTDNNIFGPFKSEAEAEQFVRS